MSHAWLVIGPPGPQRRERARLRAGDFVGKDASLALSGRHPDVQEYLEPLRIEDVRGIVSTLARPPLLGGGRVVLLGELAGSTREAQNALLRVVEEPPEGMAFVAEAVGESTILPTLRSRFALERLPRRTQGELVDALRAEFPKAEAEMLRSAARAGRGYVDRAREAFRAYRTAEEQIPPDDGKLDWYIRAAETIDSADESWLNGLVERFASAWGQTRDPRFLRAWISAEDARRNLTLNGNPRLVAEVLFSELASLGVLRHGASGGSPVS